jgi:alcohol dehydrogenase (NADP+)
MASSSDYSTVHNPTVTLNNGEKMPVLGLGTWKGKPGEVESSVQIALRVGYRYRRHPIPHTHTCLKRPRADLLRLVAAAAFSFVLTRMMLCRHIDCAKAYQNQTGLGQALQELYKEGKVSRKDFWLTTKLWNTDHAEVRKNCLESMKELQTEYLDLYLVHWPVTQHKGPALTPSMKVGICLSSERERLQCFSQTYSAPTEGCKSPLLHKYYPTLQHQIRLLPCLQPQPFVGCGSK